MEGGIFLISHTEHSLLLASLCLFFSPSAYAHVSPVSFWLARRPPLLHYSLSLSLPLSSLSLCPSPCLIEKSDTVNQLVVCRGEGERETQEVSLAVKNSPYAIWANRCKAECNKIQVWEITPTVWGGKIISAAFFFMFFVLLDFFFLSLFVFLLVMEQTPLSCARSPLSLCSAPWEQFMLNIKNSVTAALSAINVSYKQPQEKR